MTEKFIIPETTIHERIDKIKKPGKMPVAMIMGICVISVVISVFMFITLSMYVIHGDEIGYKTLKVTGLAQDKPLLPGVHFINPLYYDVDIVDKIEIPSGQTGDIFSIPPHHHGTKTNTITGEIEFLQPGMYIINFEENEVTLYEE